MKATLLRKQLPHLTNYIKIILMTQRSKITELKIRLWADKNQLLENFDLLDLEEVYYWLLDESTFYRKVLRTFDFSKVPTPTRDHINYTKERILNPIRSYFWTRDVFSKVEDEPYLTPYTIDMYVKAIGLRAFDELDKEGKLPQP